MITKCMTGIGITVGVVGLMAFSPVQDAPPTPPPPSQDTFHSRRG